MRLCERNLGYKSIHPCAVLSKHLQTHLSWFMFRDYCLPRGFNICEPPVCLCYPASAAGDRAHYFLSGHNDQLNLRDSGIPRAKIEDTAWRDSWPFLKGPPSLRASASVADLCSELLSVNPTRNLVSRACLNQTCPSDWRHMYNSLLFHCKDFSHIACS